MPFCIPTRCNSAGLRDHAPPQPTPRWQAGTEVSSALPLTFPLGPPRDGGGRFEVFVGLLDPASGEVARIADAGDRSGLVRIGEFEFAPAATVDVDAVIAEATAGAGKDPQAAWDQLEFASRRVDGYPQKQQLQKALLAVGPMAPAAMTFEERDITAQRIADERAPYLRLVAGRMFDRGRLLGALLRARARRAQAARQPTPRPAPATPSQGEAPTASRLGAGAFDDL